MAVNRDPAAQPIRPDELYTLGTFIRYTGVGRTGIRQARRKGLQAYCTAGRVFILGRDWIDYVTANGKASKDA